ncbi:MAG: hypothetical protein EGQ00_04100 [Parabacteroides johnsonii]|nr:hypothetical protein [Parabacteroides johnsonii]
MQVVKGIDRHLNLVKYLQKMTIRGSRRGDRGILTHQLRACLNFPEIIMMKIFYKKIIFLVSTFSFPFVVYM